MFRTCGSLPVACLCAAGLASAPASAQASAQAFLVASANAAVTILSATAAAQTEDLGGDLGAANVEGEVVVDPAAREAPASARKSPLRPAAYSLAGRKGAAFALTLPGPGDCVLAGPLATIPITGFKVSVGGAAATATPGGLTLDPKGLKDFKVGASLQVAKGLPRSAYIGKFKVTMSFN